MIPEDCSTSDHSASSQGGRRAAQSRHSLGRGKEELGGFTLSCVCRCGCGSVVVVMVVVVVVAVVCVIAVGIVVVVVVLVVVVCV